MSNLLSVTVFELNPDRPRTYSSSMWIHYSPTGRRVGYTFKQALCDHALGNYRVLFGIANDLLLTAARNDLPQLDEKLLQHTSAPQPRAVKRAAQDMYGHRARSAGGLRDLAGSGPSRVSSSHVAGVSPLPQSYQ